MTERRPALHIESVFPDNDRRRAYRVVYRNVEIRTFTNRDRADDFVRSIEEAIR